MQTVSILNFSVFSFHSLCSLKLEGTNKTETKLMAVPADPSIEVEEEEHEHEHDGPTHHPSAPSHEVIIKTSA
jgi:hypothetical protein